MSEEVNGDGYVLATEHEEFRRSLIEKFRLRKYRKARRRMNELRREELRALSDEELSNYSKSVTKGPGWTESRGDIIGCLSDEFERRNLRKKF